MSKQIQAVINSEELATLLIPISGRQLVLPNVTVAEIIPYQQPQPLDESPAWYMGTFRWRNIDVPLVAFEVLNGESMDYQNRSHRIAVLNGLVDSERLPFCAIVTSGVPRLMRVSPDEVASDDENSAGAAELARVLVSGERAAIPDVDYIQQQLLALSGL